MPHSALVAPGRCQTPLFLLGDKLARGDMLPRTTHQAILLFGGLIVLAVALHLMFCRWAYTETTGKVGRIDHGGMPVLTYTHELLYSRPKVISGGVVRIPAGWTMSGLFARHSPESAKVWGIAVPVLLIGGTIYLFLLWRYDHRRHKGRCTSCGYQITPVQSKRCPECGAPEA